MIPITTARWHGIAWDGSHPGGAIWMVTGSSDINRYVMQNGKLHHTTTCGLMKYDATTGALLETADLLGHVEEDLRLVHARARSVPLGECRDRASLCRRATGKLSVSSPRVTRRC